MKKLFIFILILSILSLGTGIAAKTVVDLKAPKVVESSSFIQQNKWLLEQVLKVVSVEGMQDSGTVQEKILSLVKPQTADELLGDGLQISGIGSVHLQQLIDGISLKGIEFSLPTILRGRVPDFVISHLPVFVWIYAKSQLLALCGAVGSFCSVIALVVIRLVRKRG